MTIENMEAYTFRTLGFETGPYSYVYVKDLTFRNIKLFARAFHVVNGKIVYFENLNIINCTIEGTELFSSEASNLSIK